MARKFSRYQVASQTYAAQRQDTFRLDGASVYGELVIQLEGQGDTTAATLNPHPVQVPNILAGIEVYDNNANTYINLSGVAAALAVGTWRDGTAGDNAALAGGAIVNNAAYRHTLRIPFDLHDGHDPQDTHLHSITKDLNVRSRYNDPLAVGTMFGTVAGLVNDFLTVSVGVSKFRTDVEDPAVLKAPARSLREEFTNVAATSDKLKETLPKNEEYRGIFLNGESLVNNVWTPSDAVFDMTKILAVKSTRDNNTWQAELARVFKTLTAQRRQIAVSSIPGLIDLPLINLGRAGQNIYSDDKDELFLELPVVKQAGETRVRVITDTLMSQVPGTR